MSIIANANGSNYEPIPAGTYVARCYSMIHIGTITQEYLGVDKEMNKVRVYWELPTEMKVFSEEKGEQPLSISKEFTLSMHEKANLRKFLESWRGRGFKEEEAKAFDVTKLLGVPCMVSIIHKTSKQGKTYAEISGISTIPKGMTCPEQINSVFEFNYNQFDQNKFDSLPDWLKDKMKGSKEYKKLTEPNNVHDERGEEQNEGSDDDLPF